MKLLNRNFDRLFSFNRRVKHSLEQRKCFKNEALKQKFRFIVFETKKMFENGAVKQKFRAITFVQSKRQRLFEEKKML